MALTAPGVVWYGIVSSGKDPPRAHARLMTDKGLSERPLCGLNREWGEPQPTMGWCRRCQDIAATIARHGRR